VSGGARGSTRRHLLYYLEVLDRASGVSLGRLGDIHEDGLLLLTPLSLGPGNRFAVAVQMPAPIGMGRATLDLDIEVRWSRKEATGIAYQNGCSFVSLSQADKDYIDGLVERIGFSDGQRKIVLRNDANTFIETDEGSGHHE
jgi:hypothetical protein